MASIRINVDGVRPDMRIQELTVEQFVELMVQVNAQASEQIQRSAVRPTPEGIEEVVEQVRRRIEAQPKPASEAEMRKLVAAAQADIFESVARDVKSSWS
ncbi:MAG: hypothetical protein AAF467_12130 [Actinomycetota bacterium]